MKHRILRFDGIPFYAFEGETPFPADGDMPSIAALPCKARIDFPGGAGRPSATPRVRLPQKNFPPISIRNPARLRQHRSTSRRKDGKTR